MKAVVVQDFAEPMKLLKKCRILCIQTVKQAYYVEILKWLHEAVHRKKPELWPNNWILHNDDNAPAHMTLASSFWSKKSITEMEHPPYSPDLVLKDFWLFQKIKSACKG
jgi:hypothetical protein